LKSRFIRLNNTVIFGRYHGGSVTIVITLPQHEQKRQRNQGEKGGGRRDVGAYDATSGRVKKQSVGFRYR
jgi:hypothetical protein